MKRKPDYQCKNLFLSFTQKTHTHKAPPQTPLQSHNCMCIHCMLKSKRVKNLHVKRVAIMSTEKKNISKKESKLFSICSFVA